MRGWGTNQKEMSFPSSIRIFQKNTNPSTIRIPNLIIYVKRRKTTFSSTSETIANSKPLKTKTMNPHRKRKIRSSKIPKTTKPTSMASDRSGLGPYNRRWKREFLV